MMQKLYNACWYMIGGFILLLAVGITIIRLLLPGIDQYREQIEDLAGHYSGYPISIQEVQAEWLGWQPQLLLRGVVLHEPDQQQPIASFKSARLNFALLASLWKQQVVPASLTISGADLEVIRTAEGAIRFSDENLPKRLSSDDGRIQDNLSRWLLGQPLISLTNTSIRWVDKMRDRPPLQLTQASLHLRTWQERTQIDGQAKLPDSHGETFNFALDLTGNLLQGDWSGQMYFSAENLEPAAWPSYSRWRDISVTAGRTDISIWSHWQQARLTDARGHIALVDTLLRGGDGSSLIRDMEAEFDFYRRGDNSWQLNTLLQELATWNGEDQLNIESMYISHLKVEDILPLVGLHNVLPQRLQNSYTGKVPAGVLENIQFQRNESNNDWLISGEFNQLALMNRQGRQLVGGLRGLFIADPAHGRIKFDQAPLQIDNPALFRSPLQDLSMDGVIDLHRQSDDSLRVTTDMLRVDTDPHELALRGEAVFDSQGLPQVNIVSAISAGNTQPLKRFIPVFAKDKLKRWLDRSIVDGNMKYAGMVLRGDLDDFPFDAGDGQFKLDARFNQVTLAYDEKWPSVRNVSGDISIDQETLSIHVPSASLYQAGIQNVHARIADLFAEDHDLTITGHAEGSTGDAIRFLRSSPLQDKNTIKRLFDLQLDGRVRVGLDLLLRLYPNAEDSASGDIELLGNNIKATRLGIELADTTGHITFDDNQIGSENLQASYYGTPVELAIKRDGAGTDTPTLFSMTGQLDGDLLRQILSSKLPADAVDPTQLTRRIEGQSRWRAELISYPQADQPESFSIESNLTGIAIDLPAPLGKPAADSRELRLDFQLLPENAPLQQLQLDYGNIMSAQYRDEGLAIQFGHGSNPSPVAGRIDISGQTDTLVLDDWLALLLDQPAFNTVTDPGNAWQFHVDLNANRLQVYGQMFDATGLKLFQQPEHWQLNLTGPDIAGNIRIPNNLASQPVNADLQHLKLDALDNNNSRINGQPLDPRQFPALQVNVENFIYDDARFGTFNLAAQKQDNGLRINRFSFAKPGLQIQGQGDWYSASNEFFSRFDIDLHADKISGMLETFNYYDESIRDGETDINVKAMWPGSPFDFSLANMDGSLALEIGAGRFLDLDPKAGRIFGLLSVQTLPRRLSLDFSDLFKKGFVFDSIYGNFTIEGGNAYTNDLAMKGPAALVTVTGRTGLVAQDYDQVVTVIPQVSDSLPVAGALFGPIGIGVGAVIFITGKMFDSIPEQIDRMLGYQYSVKGSWKDPSINPLEKDETSEVPARADGKD